MSQSPNHIANLFYSSFAVKDFKAMASLYHPSATFSDEVFLNLNADEAGQMWAMLCTRSADLKVDFNVLESTSTKVVTRWNAYYTFSKTGRAVHNSILSTIEIQNGKIISHRDSFSFWAWSRQAFGILGLLIGWTPILKSKVRQEARKSLTAFMQKNAQR